MKIRRNHIVFITALIVTVPLLIFAFSPIYLIHVKCNPQSLNSVQILSLDTIIRSETKSIVYFDFKAFIVDQSQSISKVNLFIRPSSIPTWVQQMDYLVTNSYIIGTAQLGSENFPVIKNEHYLYRLIAENGTLLSDGTIDATVDKISGGDSWLIAVIGILASVLQIVSIFIEPMNTIEKIEKVM